MLDLLGTSCIVTLHDDRLEEVMLLAHFIYEETEAQGWVAPAPHPSWKPPEAGQVADWKPFPASMKL